MACPYPIIQDLIGTSLSTYRLIQISSRFHEKNIILRGLWQAKHKMNTVFPYLFLKREKNFTTTDHQLNMYGYKNYLCNYECYDHWSESKSKCITVQHKGMCLCIFCEESGLVVKSVKGRTRCYSYREVKLQLRSSISIAENATAAPESTKAVCGLKWKVNPLIPTMD